MSRRAKRFPPPLQTTEPGGRGEQPVVLGGSLTRSPEGRLQTLQTHGIYPAPQVVQDLWNAVSRRRYPASWDRQQLPPDGYIVEWEPRRIACGCGRDLGEYVAYRVLGPANGRRKERGIVEKTSRRYHRDPHTAAGQAASRGPRARPRYWLERMTGLTAEKTTAYFLCPGCHKEHQRNLANLGQQLFDHPTDVFRLE